MIRRYSWWLAIALTAGAFVASAALYARLPEQIPIHWNIRGEVDGYGSKSWAVFLCPGCMAAVIALFALLPRLSPKQFEVDSFRETYLFVMVLIVALFGYIHALTLLAALGHSFGMDRTLMAGLFLFFALMGNVMGKLRRNFWIGIRVPWTLASERVWNDTHRLAAWLWVAGGLVGFALALAGLPVVSLVVLGVIVVVPIAFSLLLYKRLEKSADLGDNP